ncbi:sigma-54-dependent Fis family transcriptional regulator [Mucilaginibacter rigui]|uniref:Sigma-54-dependent Fis family transcriptional regulator n=1 Tax=Mucilaginibacter rigui TaxID=534635 RepID=A0ABR7X742_9SPHI|nr:sigma-54-dependent Fis family transcriptional regulator [Mucilaginibacter rigui]MBD1385910.1 sigma-54-dependent Fis family transcriptional regulator [Mucilaginibacter rigui]
MKENILIVEDEFIVANDLRLMLTKAGYYVCGTAASVNEAKKIIEKENPTWVLLDIFLQDGSRGTELADFLTARKIGFVYISANTNQKVLESATATQPYGFLVKPFRERDLLIMLEIAREKHSQNLELVQQRETLLLQQVQSLIAAPANPESKMVHVPAAFQALIPFDYMKIDFFRHNEQADQFNFIRKSFGEYEILKNSALPESMGLTGRDLNLSKPKPIKGIGGYFLNGMDFRRSLLDDAWDKMLSNHFQLEAKLSHVFILEDKSMAVMSFYSRNPSEYASSKLALLLKANNAIVDLLYQVSVESSIPFVTSIKQPVVNNKMIEVAPGPKAPTTGFKDIVGNSPELLKVLDNILVVSKAEISVLITGESGTGKEKVAHNIHLLSARKNKPYIVVNCAALPHELIESELFGHEKGAYTGAIEKRVGKFELADGGTIFLDEIGEMPLEAQVKLLRVLQEKEIDHVGGKLPVKVNIRVIAATNRKLEKEVAEGRFRLDLYYRLNVFPISLPPLRARKEDIPELAAHFLKIFAKDTGRNVDRFTSHALGQLASYDWPGNIRELGHFIQRCMLISTGPVIERVELPETISEDGKGFIKTPALRTLEEMEKQHIVGVLKNCKGKVCGPGGAAEILDLPPSTLNSKMKKLGITREYYFNV